MGAAARGVGDLLLWWVILPCAIAFLIGAYYVSPALFFGVIIVIVVVTSVVLLTTIASHLKATRVALERQMCDEEASSTENP